MTSSFRAASIGSTLGFLLVVVFFSGALNSLFNALPAASAFFFVVVVVVVIFVFFVVAFFPLTTLFSGFLSAFFFGEASSFENAPQQSYNSGQFKVTRVKAKFFLRLRDRDRDRGADLQIGSSHSLPTDGPQ